MKEFKQGQIWKGNKNNRKIKILNIENSMVKYQDLKYKTAFLYGYKAMQRCDISLVK